MRYINLRFTYLLTYLLTYFYIFIVFYMAVATFEAPGNPCGRLGCFHDSCLSENNYFDELNFKYEYHESRLYYRNS